MIVRLLCPGFICVVQAIKFGVHNRCKDKEKAYRNQPSAATHGHHHFSKMLVASESELDRFPA
jgi:hypothetical protein